MRWAPARLITLAPILRITPARGPARGLVIGLAIEGALVVLVLVVLGLRSCGA